MKTKASRIIFIPSFGTNSTLYDNIKLADENHSKVIKSEWLGIQERESFETYALKFINHYDISHHDILVGTSLGGIIAQEINKQIPVKQVIIISSLKSEKEMPRLFTMIRQLRLYYFFSPVLLKLGLDLVVPLYGRQVKRYLWFRRVFKQSDNDFLRWSFKNIVHWKNESIVENLIHIHGSKDPLFPLKNIKNPDYEIAGGTHAMVRFKGSEISEIIDTLICKSHDIST